jgi:hypothetical protein
VGARSGRVWAGGLGGKADVTFLLFWHRRVTQCQWLGVHPHMKERGELDDRKIEVRLRRLAAFYRLNYEALFTQYFRLRSLPKVLVAETPSITSFEVADVILLTLFGCSVGKHLLCLLGIAGLELPELYRKTSEGLARCFAACPKESTCFRARPL